MEAVRIAILKTSFDDMDIASCSFLDIGCGIGECMRLLQSIWGTRSLYGIDISSEMITQAMQYGNVEQLDFSGDPGLTTLKFPKTFD